MVDGRRLSRSGYELNGPYMRSIAEAARAGNPETLVSENYWGCLVEVYEERDGVIYGNFRSKVPDPVDADDYSAGELVQLGDLPDGRTLAAGYGRSFLFWENPRIPGWYTQDGEGRAASIPAPGCGITSGP